MKEKKTPRQLFFKKSTTDKSLNKKQKKRQKILQRCHSSMKESHQSNWKSLNEWQSIARCETRPAIHLLSSKRLSSCYMIYANSWIVLSKCHLVLSKHFFVLLFFLRLSLRSTHPLPLQPHFNLRKDLKLPIVQGFPGFLSHVEGFFQGLRFRL